MELQFESKTCRYLRRNVRQMIQQEQTQEVKLPEELPDIGSILGAWGQCVMRGKEWNTDQIGTSGGVMAWVLYAPADGSAPRAVEAWLPFQFKWNMSPAQRAGTIRCHWLLKGVDGRTLSARKMMVRATVSVLGEAWEPWQEEIMHADQLPEDVQLLRNTYPARLPMEAGEKAFAVDEELLLNDPAEKILSCSVTPHLTEQKVLDGKAVFRGNVSCHLVYGGADGWIHSSRHEMDFSQFTDLDQDHDSNARLDTVMAVSGLEPELQDGRIRIKCGMIVQYLVSGITMLDVAEDGYSPLRTVNMEFRPLLLPMILDEHQETLKYGCTIPETAMQVADVSVHMDHCAVHRAGELTQFVCEGQAQVLFYDENGTLQSASSRWSAETEMPVSSEADILAVAQDVTAPLASCSTGQIDLGGEVQMTATTVSRSPIEMVTAVELGQLRQPDPSRPSLILRRAGKEGLWQMAKESGSTVDAICAANGLTAEPTEARLLLIPIT